MESILTNFDPSQMRSVSAPSKPNEMRKPSTMQQETSQTGSKEPLDRGSKSADLLKPKEDREPRRKTSVSPSGGGGGERRREMVRSVSPDARSSMSAAVLAQNQVSPNIAHRGRGRGRGDPLLGSGRGRGGGNIRRRNAGNEDLFFALREAGSSSVDVGVIGKGEPSLKDVQEKPSAVFAERNFIEEETGRNSTDTKIQRIEDVESSYWDEISTTGRGYENEGRGAEEEKVLTKLRNLSLQV